MVCQILFVASLAPSNNLISYDGRWFGHSSMILKLYGASVKLLVFVPEIMIMYFLYLFLLSQATVLILQASEPQPIIRRCTRRPRKLLQFALLPMKVVRHSQVAIYGGNNSAPKAKTVSH